MLESVLDIVAIWISATRYLAEADVFKEVQEILVEISDSPIPLVRH